MPILSRLRSLNKNEFFKHGKNYIAGGFLSHGLTFLSIPILTRLLSPNDYGMIAVFVSMVAVFPVLIGLNFNGALSRKYYENDETYGEFIYTIIRFITFFGVLIVGS
ncbi:oligosaccharide flippase family protein, partial [Myxococcota bacterium]|nr:oligosaccharide flippase family protein [Myxococcota bacterium]